MTLHNTVETMKKAGVGGIIGVITIIFCVILFRVGVFIKDIIDPPKIIPPTVAYDLLPALQFPKDAVSSDLTYTLNTLTGELPEFPDRLVIYPLVEEKENFLNLDKAKAKVAALGFVSPEGSPIPEIPLGNASYEWDEQTGIARKIIFNTVNFDFKLNSDYQTSLNALGAQHLSNQKSAITTARSFLETVELLPEDLDIEKTENPEKEINYVTAPQLFSIDKNVGTLIPATSLAQANVIRVEFYQKDMEYKLDTGNPKEQYVDMKLPILYPHPPYSTMSFWIASGATNAQVVAANYVHHSIVLPAEGDVEPAATYPIKTAKEAFEELKEGQGYIAAYGKTDTSILINNVYLAYYLGEEKQKYLMPVMVFEGDGGFFAYVSAVKSDWIQ